eukprot:2142155-Prymnesium_polylepis.2
MLCGCRGRRRAHASERNGGWSCGEAIHFQPLLCIQRARGWPWLVLRQRLRYWRGAGVGAPRAARLEIDHDQLLRMQEERRVAETLEDVLALHLRQHALRNVLRQVHRARLEHERHRRVVVVVRVEELPAPGCHPRSDRLPVQNGRGLEPQRRRTSTMNSDLRCLSSLSSRVKSACQPRPTPRLSGHRTMSRRPRSDLRFNPGVACLARVQLDRHRPVELRVVGHLDDRRPANVRRARELVPLAEDVLLLHRLAALAPLRRVQPLELVSVDRRQKLAPRAQRVHTHVLEVDVGQ